MIGFLRKYYLLLSAVVCSLVFVAYYDQTFSTDYAASVDQLVSGFHSLETKLEKTLDYKSKEIRKNGISGQWDAVGSAPGTNLHVYRHDSLIFWNTNQLPIIRFANLHFPADGILHLQNGWYYAKTIEAGDYVLCASVLIRQEYAYRNESLENGFAPNLKLPFDATISLNQEVGYPIRTKDGTYAFSVVPSKTQTVSSTESIVLVLLLFASLATWLYWLYTVRKKMTSKWTWGILAGVLILRFVSLRWEWFGFMHSTEAFDPSLYATSHWLPNFFEYLVNMAVIVFVLNDIILRLQNLPKSVWRKWMVLILFAGSFAFWLFFLAIIRGIIENSSIPLVIDKLFSLNIYSLLAVASLGLLFYAYYWFVHTVLIACREQGWSGTQLAVGTFFLGCSLFLYEITYGNQLFLASVFPLLFYEWLLYLVYRQRQNHQLANGIILLMVFSLVLAASLETFNERKERGERELYASQLAMEKNIATELEYAGLVPGIKADGFLQRFIENPHPINTSDFEDGMERRLFHGFWESYDMNFYLFDEAHEVMTDTRKGGTNRYDVLQGIIEHSGTPSEIDSNIFLIHNHSKNYSYIIRQDLYGKDSTRATLFCTLVSKKIPEEIGFPRLLISADANVLEPLESYSIAKYHKGRLVNRYGSFNYPSAAGVMLPFVKEGKGFFDYQEFNHFILEGSDEDILVLSIRNSTLVDLVTSFSYLFSFFGLLLMPLLFRLDSGHSWGKRLSLAMKIQGGLISLVFLSLLTFGWGSGLFVRTQYNQFTNDMIREKLSSVETEVAARFGGFSELNIDENGNYMQAVLQEFAQVFFTDINMYDRDGYLLATSRPKVFNVGLLSEQMNPEAFKYMERLRQSEFVHQENIGKLRFSSAYKPFYNASGVQLGYINLQHFGQQREFENQIQRFLVAIINVFILLLAVSVILAIFISNWLTSPLRILQENFASVKFGKYNEHIHYDREDEIGSLVKDYNQKLDELEYAAQQLARNEREMAWREMAKQVAHEIKNPLTPMKLSVQQLLRVYDPNDPKSAEKLRKVTNSIIEQIDALTRIANEFSSFAKMPNPNEERLELVALIQGVKEVFEGQCLIELEMSEKELFVVGDKDQFVRVFNNLIKNAIQAIPKEREGLIRVVITSDEQKIHIEIRDNGAGIDPSQHGKIFVPYFTTKGTGSGLGLAMVKQIVEGHKGTIDFESTVGVGTTFIIDLPRA